MCSANYTERKKVWEYIGNYNGDCYFHYIEYDDGTDYY